MFQTREQDKNLQEQLNKVVIGNLPEKEFRVMISKMIQDFRKRMEAQIKTIQEMFNKELEDLKNKETEMNNTVTGMKNKPNGINRIIEAEEWISVLKSRMVEITAAEENKEKRMKRNEDSLRDVWDNIKQTNICIIWVPEGEERKGLRKYLKRL